jgi:hypothetical protein
MSSINVLNSQKSEFNWSNVKIDCEHNIVLHCVYDPVNHFEDEFNFLLDKQYRSDTLIILWHAVEEGPWYDTVWIEKLNKIIKTAPYKLIYLTGCSHRLTLLENLKIEFDVKFFPIFDIRSKDIWRTGLVFDPIKTKKFIFLNAKDGQHKRYVLGKLIQNNLLDSGHVSYQCSEGLLDTNQSIGINRFHDYISTMEYCNPYIPIRIDNSNISTKLPRNIFEQSYVNVVSETRFPNVMKYKTNFVTEKTFNAIANNQIFIIVGHAGSLDLLKSLGYKTFDCIIDETYDNVYNNSQRLQRVSNTIINYLKKPINEIQEDYIKIKDIIEHNRNLLYLQSLESRLQSFINDLYSK